MARRLPAPISGRQLVISLGIIAMSTVVVPPGAAWWLNRHRVAQTRERALHAADDVRLHGAARGVDHVEASVVCGPGRLPKAGESGPDEWVRYTAIAPQVFGAGMPTDAWGQCFLMNVGQWKGGGRVWVLSAGPNGRIDTPLGATIVQGDDIGAIVR